jgi:two-component system KDP operon response regulator KdpE
VEVTRRLREWSQVPVIILSVRDQELDKIAALDAGADDYLTKPFGVGELLARIRTVLRRQTSGANEPIFTVGGLIVDLGSRLVKVDGNEIQLTPTEYDILRALVIHAGKVLTNRQILKQVWGEGYDDLHILRVNVSNLRHKIEPDPSRPTYIHTEPGVGYRLKL